MAKKENEQATPIPLENPTIKKVVKCPGCGAKVEVEFEIELDTIIPATLAGALAEAGKPVEEDEEPVKLAKFQGALSYIQGPGEKEEKVDGKD